MKKGFMVVLLVLLAGAMVFAAATKHDVVTVSAEIDGNTSYAFTQNDLSTKDGFDVETSGDLTSSTDPVSDNTLTILDPSVEFYASARTNDISAPVSMKVSATALTRYTSGGDTSNKYTEDKVTLTLKSEKESEVECTEAVTADLSSSGFMPSSGSFIEISEDTVPDNATGYRTYSEKITITAVELDKATAGQYEAFVTLYVESSN